MREILQRTRLSKKAELVHGQDCRCDDVLALRDEAKVRTSKASDRISLDFYSCTSAWWHRSVKLVRRRELKAHAEDQKSHRRLISSANESKVCEDRTVDRS